MNRNIHSSAVISPSAQIGENVSIGPFVVIEDHAVIGDDTWIGTNAFVGARTRIGRGCKIHNTASVGSPPQDLKYKGEETTLEIGDNTVVREFATLNRGTIESGKTVIGSNCLLMAYSHVAHDCVVGNHVIMANCATLAGHVRIEDYVIIGGLTPVHQFCRIGEHALVGGAFRVVKDVPPYILAGQNPLVFEGLNLIGLRRRGFSRETIDQIDLAYRAIYRSNLNVSQAVEQLRKENSHFPEIGKILDFIATSKRGIIPGHSR